ncbi:ATPase WRNIP1 [Impatiens glandulifera]|uniref:ATPase WRNIP1 n=1 Tax=Impatiens glandulifera TaxID=253017 RepID=UPI001FB0B0A8|nr:ATPase WRNIP1 [Impatiens glandulifera]
MDAESKFVGGSATAIMERQLLSMGFSKELASQALTATGAKSITDATDWILNANQTHSCPAAIDPNPNPSPTDTHPFSSSPNPNPNPSPFQPKINRFFLSHSKPNEVIKPKRQITIEEDIDEEEEEHDVPLRTKRPKQQQQQQQQSEAPPNQPLSERMRPRVIDEVVGQDHLLSEKSFIRSSVDCNRLPSIILWGPPGTGKTSIARAIVNSCSSSYRFVSLSAVTAGVKDVRDVVEEARKLRKMKITKRTVLFIDEVHRFNKSQQDSFLPVIEDGTIVFMGATTENPSFHLITPLLSRCRVLTLNPLKPNHISSLIKRAIADKDKGLLIGLVKGLTSIEVDEDAIEFLSLNCDGDARVALNALEISTTMASSRATECSSICRIVVEDAKEAMQSKHLAYDKSGEEHYNLISALHKSMRGNDANAAIYWLARMLEGGEQPLYIARRLIRFASEDVGLADPSALLQAVGCYQACHFIGMPECNVNLAQCVAYLALAPKSVSVYRAIKSAITVVRDSVGQNEGVPLHIRNAPTKLMKELGYGKGYIYTPDDPSSSSEQTYLPSALQGYKFLQLQEEDNINGS